jgi:hypothetical protein
MGKRPYPWRPQLTLKEFEASYARDKGRPWADLDVVAVPCACGQEHCTGWAAWPRHALRLVAVRENFDVKSIARVLKCPDPGVVRDLIQLLSADS